MSAEVTSGDATRILLTADLDGSEANETITSTLDGVTHEIDLNGQNAQQLRGSVSAYVTSAHKRSSRRTPTTRRAAAKPASDRPDTHQVRDWAKAQGIEVSERGQLSNDLLVRIQDANY